MAISDNVFAFVPPLTLMGVFIIIVMFIESPPVTNTITACEWCNNYLVEDIDCCECSFSGTVKFENCEKCIKEYRERLNYTKDDFPCYCGNRCLYPPSLLEWWILGIK